MKFGPLMSAAVLAFIAACSSSTNNSTGSTGTSNQKLSVGSPCASDAECGTAPFYCMMGDHPGGYCMRKCDIKNGDADCPSEAICQSDGTTMECHKKCGGAADCRTGYVCAPASSAADNTASHSFCDVAGMAGMGDGGMDMDGAMDMDGMSMGGGMNMDGGMGMDGM